MHIRVITVTFREDDIVDGDLPREAYDNALDDVIEVDTVEEAVDLFESHGLDFASTGNDWAASPDGSFIVNYYEGIRAEVTAHFTDDVTEDDRTAIMALVG